jgi:hypothetical protein
VVDSEPTGSDDEKQDMKRRSFNRKRRLIWLERAIKKKHYLTPVSAGFATVHGNNTLTINAVEAYPLDKFSAEVCCV